MQDNRYRKRHTDRDITSNRERRTNLKEKERYTKKEA
jgi:hypothetical protein